LPIAFKQFQTELVSLGLLTSDELETFLQKIPDRQSVDATRCAKLLVKAGVLTLYQANVLYAGKGKSLLLGNYQIIDKLGQGGMGTVMKARHRRMDRLVALKVISPAAMKSADAVKRFHREVQAAARLQHPNIVMAFDADEANGTHFLVMEYVDGIDLNSFVRKSGPLTASLAVELILQAARGLEYAHKQGVIHRDIKPANLLLDRANQVKILDMGLARLDGSVGGSAEGASLTSTGMIMGTVDYMSPEQAVDTKTADARSDIYSLGCSLYYLLTGKALYVEDTMMKRLIAHQSAEIPQLDDLALNSRPPALPAVPEAMPLNQIFQKMVAKKPEERFQSTTEVISELTRLMHFVTSGSASESPSSGGLQLPARSIMADFQRGLMGSVPTNPTRVQNPPQTSPTDEPTLIGLGHRTEILHQPQKSKWSRNTSIPLPVLLGAGAIILVVMGTGWKLLGRWTAPGVPIATSSASNEQAAHTALAETQTTSKTAQPSAETAMAADAAQPAESPPMALAMSPAANAKESTGSVSQAEPPKHLTQQEFAQSVNALPPEKKLAALRRKLMEVNPGYSGEISSYSFKENQLEVLSFENQSTIKDLSPLAGITIFELQCTGTQISDLSFMKDIPFYRTKVDYTKVSDLTPLQGKQISQISLSHTAISSIEPLRKSQMFWLDISFTPVSDLSPLTETRLIELYAVNSKISDLTPLQGKKMRNLFISGTQVTSLEPLQGMPLEKIRCDRTNVSDLSPLQGMQLKDVDLNSTQVTDLSPLRGQPITNLGLLRLKISDLSPLEGMPLTFLNLFMTDVSNLRALENCPLQTLHCDNTLIYSLQPIRKMKFAQLSCDVRLYHEPDFAAIRQASPEKIRVEWFPTGPLEQFWKSADDQRTRVEKLAEQVNALPVERQMEAVRQALVAWNDGHFQRLTGEPEAGRIRQLACVLKSWADSDFKESTRTIAPLRAFRHLTRLTLEGGPRWLDLSPLNALPLEELTCRPEMIIRNAPVLRDMPRLKIINGQPKHQLLESLVPDIETVDLPELSQGR